MAFDFKDLFNQLKIAVISLAKTEFKTYVSEAVSDGTSLLYHLKGDLETYALQLAGGKMTKNDFQLLLLGKQDLIEMTALTETGLAAAKADAFKKEVINLVIDTVFKFI